MEGEGGGGGGGGVEGAPCTTSISYSAKVCIICPLSFDALGCLDQILKSGDGNTPPSASMVRKAPVLLGLRSKAL